MPRKSRARSNIIRHASPIQGSPATSRAKPKVTRRIVVKSRQMVHGSPTIERWGRMTPPRTPRIRIRGSRRARSSSAPGERVRCLGRAGAGAGDGVVSPGTEQPHRGARPGVERIVVPLVADHDPPRAGEPGAPAGADFPAVEPAERPGDAGELVALAAGIGAQ